MRASDMTPAIYGGDRYMRRWSLLGGYPRCVLPPLVLADSTPAEISASEVENARILELVSAVEALEAALAVVSNDRPDHLIEYEDASQEAHQVALIEAWDAAQEVVNSADPELHALALQRQGEPPEASLMLALIDETGIVVNVLAVDPGWEPEPPLTSVPAGPDARVGGTYADGVFTPPAILAPFPREVTLRQLLFALVNQGWITQEEALAAAKTGEVPSSLAAMLPGMSDAEEFGMRLTWAAMYSAERSSPIWDIFIERGVATPDDVDNLFRIADGFRT